MNNTDNQAEKMAILALDVYRYALDHELDFTNASEVRNILTALHVSDAERIDITTLIQSVVALNRMTKDDVKNRNMKLGN